MSLRDARPQLVLVEQRALVIRARVIEPPPIRRKAYRSVDSAGQLVLERLARLHVEDAHRALIRAALAHHVRHQRSVARHIRQIH